MMLLPFAKKVDLACGIRVEDTDKGTDGRHGHFYIDRTPDLKKQATQTKKGNLPSIPPPTLKKKWKLSDFFGTQGAKPGATLSPPEATAIDDGLNPAKIGTAMFTPSTTDRNSHRSITSRHIYFFGNCVLRQSRCHFFSLTWSKASARLIASI
jgi:hypothetical protein